jgi:hypothetical protein
VTYFFACPNKHYHKGKKWQKSEGKDMFIYSAKMDKRKLIMVLICVAVVIVALVLIVRGGGGGKSSGGKVKVEDPYKEQIKLLRNSRLASNEDCITLLTALGWEVNIKPLEMTEVMIPEEFSDVYKNYNELQEEQGLDLTKYKGKKVMRYTFEIVNYPSGEQNVQATLLVYKNRLIGGDICSARLDGFMHSLLMPEDETSNRDPDVVGTDPAENEFAETQPPEAHGNGTQASTEEVGGIVTEEYQPVDYNDPAIFPND